MNQRLSAISILRSVLVAIGGLLLTGCEQELGPTPLHLVEVRGVVRDDHRPVSGGWIEFFPVNGTVGNLRSARLQPDGSFKADGVAIGENLIRLVNSRIESPGAAQLFGSYSSPIRRVITDQSATSLDVDLVQEAIRFQKRNTRQSSGESLGTGALP